MLTAGERPVVGPETLLGDTSPAPLTTPIAAGASADWSTPVPVAPDATLAPVLSGNAMVATDGDTYLIVTDDGRGTRALRADAEGRITNLESIPLGPAIRSWPWSNGPYGVAGNGSEWLISLYSGARLLHPDGRVTFANALARASVVSNGRNFLAWSRERRAEVVASDGRTTAVDRNALPEVTVAASSNGDVYAVAGFTGHSIFINVIDGEGRPRFAEPKQIAVVPPAGNRRLVDVDIARVHTNFRLLWLEHDSGDPQIGWTISSMDFTPQGDVLSPQRVVAEGFEPRVPYLSPTGSLVVTQAGPADAIVRWTFTGDEYRQTTLGCGTAFASRYRSFASNGRTVVASSSVQAPYATLSVRSAPFACDPAGLDSASPQIPSWAAGDQLDFILAAGRRDVLVSWSESGVRHARLVSHAGRPLRSMRLPEETDPSAFLRIDTDGSDYVAVWMPHDRRSIRFARVVGAGESPAPVITLATFREASQGMDVEWDGASYVVVWSGNNDYYGTQAALLGMRVSRDGTISRSATEILSPDRHASARARVALARSGDALLAAWYIHGSGGGLPCGGCQNPQGVRAVRIDADLHPVGAVAELSGPGHELKDLFGNGDAWYVFSQDWYSKSNQVSRIDGSGAVRTIDAGAGDLSGVPLGELGFGLFSPRDFRLFDDPDRNVVGWPHRPVDPRQVTFVRAGASLLSLFAERIDRLPYNGAHRAFVTSLQLEAAPGRRRPARN